MSPWDDHGAAELDLATGASPQPTTQIPEDDPASDAPGGRGEPTTEAESRDEPVPSGAADEDTGHAPEHEPGGGDVESEDESEVPPPSVPDVVGDDSGAARAALAAAGYENLDHWMPNPYFYSPLPEQCQVVSQDPAPGANAGPGSTISLEVFDPAGKGCP